MVRYPEPTRGASLLLALRPAGRPVLVVGSGTLAASRIFTALEADANVLIAARGGIRKACEEVQWRVYHGDAEWLNAEQAVADDENDTRPEEQQAKFGALLDENPNIQIVCITDTLSVSSSVPRRSATSATILARVCKERRIPVTVADMPALCDFTFPATHRFPLTKEALDDPNLRTVDIRGSSLQLAITANGQGCRLASRLKRELVARLPRNIGDAVDNVGRLRMLAKSADENPEALESSIAMRDSGIDIRPSADIPAREMEDDDIVPLNRPVAQLMDIDESPAERTARRMRWVAQISEYTPLEQLAAMDEASMRAVLSSRSPPPGKPEDKKNPSSNSRPSAELVPSQHNLKLDEPSPPAAGRIILVGSGPGHPGLLTRAAHHALTQLATVVLADKLVPAEIMAIIPKGVEVRVAKKYPGNAEHAQDELISLAIQGAQQGKCVVRLKQGDPFLYGRGGEEFLAFKKAGYPCVIIPGISSALAAPLLTGIPVTQRGVADTLVVCTAVGKGGKGGVLVGYERGRSVSVLMGVARLAEVARALMTGSSVEAAKDGARDATPTPSRSTTSAVSTLGSLPTPITPTVPTTSVISASTLSTTKPPILSTTVPTSTSTSASTPSASSPPTPISSPLTLSGPTYPPYTPIAIIERGSSPDQRLVASTLSNIVSALERSGGQRPPGMILIGWAVLALSGSGELAVLEDGEGKKEDVEKRDRDRVGRWLGGKEYVIREGLADGWEAFDGLGAIAPIV
ncbi:hypothetical protein BDV93DRAFT_607714 [Ceratobasidium sp. AG-I]|nr:hypothetical protein BDV93DRAFT_607714 [Ceratobasidium sp. AG-I]